VAALAVFALTYLAVAAGRFPGLSLDRPAAALLGAVLMVAVGALSPEDAAHAVNGDTIGLLLGMMVLTEYLRQAAFFHWASFGVIQSVSGPRTLLWGIALVAGGLSAFLVNDTICLMMTPLVIRIVDDAGLPPLPYLLAVAFGSNAGGAATLTGNPQNMIVGTLSGISYARFASALAIPAAVALVLAAAMLHLVFRRDLPRRRFAPTLSPPPLDRRLLAKALGATALALAGFLAGVPLAWTALSAAALLMAVGGRAPREALHRVDWPLLLFFAGLFVVVAGVARAGAADWMFERFAPWLGEDPARQAVVFGLFSAAASQVVSNVPFVILAGEWIPRLADPTLLWLATALSATLAGNLTMVGSVANLIVLELAGSRASVSFWGFLRVGALVTGVTLAAGLAVLLAERALGFI
jgi:Na+/H+ antiporter NhaD/arsenite permease-like protein